MGTAVGDEQAGGAAERVDERLVVAMLPAGGEDQIHVFATRAGSPVIGVHSVGHQVQLLKGEAQPAVEQVDLVGRVDQDAVHLPMGLRPLDDRRLACARQVVPDHEVRRGAPLGSHGEGHGDANVLAVGEHDVRVRELGEGGAGMAEREPDRPAMRGHGKPAPVE